MRGEYHSPYCVFCVDNAALTSEDELRFGPLASTRMAGPGEAMARERAFLDALARVTSYELDERTLTLLADGDAVARLSR